MKLNKDQEAILAQQLQILTDTKEKLLTERAKFDNELDKTEELITIIKTVLG